MLIIAIMTRSIRWTTTHQSVGRKQLFPYFYSLLSLVLASIHAPSFSVWQTAEPVLYLFFQPNEVSILLSKHQTVLFLFIQEIISRVKRISFKPYWIDFTLLLIHSYIFWWGSVVWSLYLTDNGHICIRYHPDVCISLSYNSITYTRQQLFRHNCNKTALPPSWYYLAKFVNKVITIPTNWYWGTTLKNSARYSFSSK